MEGDEAATLAESPAHDVDAAPGVLGELR